MTSLYSFKKAYKAALLLSTLPTLCLPPSALLFSAPAFEIPAEYGRIEKNFPGPNPKTLILIQEAHADYGAQKAIAEILRHLIEKGSIRLVLVEGGWDDVGLSSLRNYGSPEGRVEVAERYLKEGKISAEEYLDITTKLDFSVWGIEDAGLYAENMEAFLKIHEKQAGWLPELSEAETRVNELKKKIYPEVLLQLEEKKSALEEKKIGLVEYLDFLKKNAGGLFPDSLKIIPAVVVATDPEKAEWEKSNLIKLLTKKLTKPELERLSLLEARKSPEEELEFLRSLLEFHKKHQKKLKGVSVKNLERYAHSLEEVSAAGPREIFKEFEALERAVREKLLVTPEQKELAKTGRSLELLRKLFELKLNPEEFEELEKNPPATTNPDFQNAVPLAKSFYLSAQKREQALVENAVKKMEEKEDDLAAMIVGGFHADRIARALKARGYSVALVSPRFQPEDSRGVSSRYFDLLRWKWEGRKESAAR